MNKRVKLDCKSSSTITTISVSHMKIKNFTALLIVFLLSACSEPLPVEKMNYAGEWRSNQMGLLILADGTVAYKRQQNGSTTSVNGPLKEFEGNDFVVGIGPFSTTFEVSEPPHQTVDGWQMVVDGVRLTKIASVKNE